jgi:transposase InsO family protein
MLSANPSSAWVTQQIREATPYGTAPKYLIHDNDCIFVDRSFQNFLANANINVKKTSFHSPWQNGICERLVGIIRQELLNHIIPFSQRHLEALLKEFVFYYNTVRTHQGIKCQTPISSDKLSNTSIEETILIPEPILGGLYHSYQKAA